MLTIAGVLLVPEGNRRQDPHRTSKPVGGGNPVVGRFDSYAFPPDVLLKMDRPFSLTTLLTTTGAELTTLQRKI